MLGRNSVDYKTWKNRAQALANMPYELEVVNLGSTVGYKDFDYAYWRIKGYNLGNQPQPLYYDIEMLKRYEEHIQKGAKIYVTIEEFKLVVDNYPMRLPHLKYYLYLTSEQIHGYSKWEQISMYLAPGLLNRRFLKQELKAIYDRVFCKKKTTAVQKPLCIGRDIADSKYWMDGWNREFGWKSQNATIDARQAENVRINTKRLLDLMIYCKEHEWDAYIVVPPFSPNLRDLMPKKVLDECLWKPMEQMRRMGYKVLDFYHDEEFADFRLYKNALTLNEHGKRLFNLKIQQLCI